MFDFFNVMSSRSITTLNERLALSCASSSLKDGGIIVEVGSAFGGSAHIVTSSAPNCELYCIDIVNSMDGSAVDVSKLHFFQGTSAEFVKHHPSLAIDMLFIDGDHSLHGVYSDFMNLGPLVREGGLILFHDADVIHPGVYIFVETLKRLWREARFEQIDKLCIMKKMNACPGVSNANCSDTLKLMALSHGGVQIEEHDLVQFTSSLHNERSYFIGRGGRGKLASEFLGLDFDRFIDAEQAMDRAGKYYVFSAFHEEIYHFLRLTKCIAPSNIFKFSDSILSYFIYRDIIDDNGKIVKSLCRSEMTCDVIDYFLLKSDQAFLHEMYRSGFLAYLFTHDFL